MSERQGRRGDDDLTALRSEVTVLKAVWDERSKTAADLRQAVLVDLQEGKASRRELYARITKVEMGQAVLQAKAAGYATLIVILAGAVLRWLGWLGG